MKNVMRAAPAALLLACTGAVSAPDFPDQPTNGRHEVIRYGNEVPSNATYPARGSDMYKFAQLGTLTCRERTYVLEVKSTIRDYPGSPEIARAMAAGHCNWASAPASTFKVIRFESYVVPTGRADLAYVTQSIAAKDLNGKQISLDNTFYVARKDIAPAH